MPHAADKALYQYMQRLCVYSNAVSNQVLQLGIYINQASRTFFSRIVRSN